MKISIKTKNITLTRAIEDFIEEKISPLEKFIKVLYDTKHFSSSSGKVKLRAEAWIEIGKETLRHKRGPFFRAEGQIRFDGKSIRAESFSKDLRIAINEVKDIMQRELKKEQQRIIAKGKRKSRALKRELKISAQARFHRKGRIREEST